MQPPNINVNAAPTSPIKTSPKKIFTASSWTFGVILILTGVGILISGQVVSGIITILAALIFIPPLTSSLKNIVWARIAVVILWFVLIAAIGNAKLSATTDDGKSAMNALSEEGSPSLSILRTTMTKLGFGINQDATELMNSIYNKQGKNILCFQKHDYGILLTFEEMDGVLTKVSGTLRSDMLKSQNLKQVLQDWYYPCYLMVNDESLVDSFFGYLKQNIFHEELLPESGVVEKGFNFFMPTTQGSGEITYVILLCKEVSPLGGCVGF